MRLTLKAGFSLIELMVVIALIGLVAGLAIINTHYLHKAVVHSEINVLTATCRYLQNSAIARNTTLELSFDEVGQCYRYEGECYQLPATVQLGFLPHIKGPPASPQALLQSAITFHDKKIIFSPDGIISSGSVYLIDVDRNDIYALTNGVSAVSFLRKYRYDGAWHLM